MSKSYFVTGTDTDVGKTFISALLVKAWKANYWKPLQTGLNCDQGDTKLVKSLTGLPEDHFKKPQVELQIPLSPWRAASEEGVPTIKVSDVIIPLSFTESERPLIVEGAGGLYVPINETEITSHLIEHLDMPTILVARSGLGTLNHTLLSIEHMKSRGIKIAGIVLNGEINTGNAETIQHFAPDIPIIAQIPHQKDGDLESLVDLVPSIDKI